MGKHVLFPTLIAVCYENQRNTSVVEQELSVDTIVDYIEKQINDKKNNSKRNEKSPEEDDLDNKENDPQTAGERKVELDSTTKESDKGGNMWSLKMMKGKNTDPLKWSFEQRFSPSLWDDALVFFNSMST